MTDPPTGHGLLLAFDVDDPEFVRGFEVGRLWTLLREHPDEEVSEYARAANAEMLLRLAEVTGRRVTTVDVDDVWLTATFEPSADLDSP